MSINQVDYNVELLIGLFLILVLAAFFLGRERGKHAADRWYATHPVIQWIPEPKCTPEIQFGNCGRGE